jgi:hypothetical protein
VSASSRNHPQPVGAVAEFLGNVLAGGPIGVPELEVMARSAGLLGDEQHITHVKAFKRAKRSLGIRSIRNGFGAGGEWLWLLVKQPAPPVTETEDSGHQLTGSAVRDTYAERQNKVSVVGDEPEEAPADRQRRRQGLRFVSIPLHVTEIDELIAAGLLHEGQRQSPEALRAVVLRLMHQALEEMRDFGRGSRPASVESRKAGKTRSHSR